jgi:4-hydroxy-3-methylbut-2-enyl diphosphate reductase
MSSERQKAKPAVILAKPAGFCFGVSRAVRLTEEAAQEGAYALGYIVHNRAVVNDLIKKGLILAEKPEDLPEGATVVIRAHGESESVYKLIKEKRIKLIDTTCPCIKRIHDIVLKEREKGREIIIIGTKGHPEALAISGRAGNAEVFETEQDVDEWLERNRNNTEKALSVVAQTTADREIWLKCIKKIKKIYTNTEIFDTICNATNERQLEAAKIAQLADVMLVIGDKMSTNTKHLFDICAERCERTYLISNAEEFEKFRFEIYKSNPKTIGVTAGASTPEAIIEEVINNMTSENQIIEGGEINEPSTAGKEIYEQKEAAAPAEKPEDKPAEETFEEMVDRSMKTLHIGQRVTGIVTRITPTDIHVDLGTKHAGFIPISELSDDPSAKPEDIVKIGEEIEVYVTKVNDSEGTVLLSRKRITAAKGWDTIDTARINRSLLEGTVVEENKGGIVVSVNGVRVFVPASHTGLPKDAPTADMIKKRVTLRILEVNRSKRRVIGSIRYALDDMRKASASKIWDTIEVGNMYEGVVKSYTSFGVFIDIGGVDGMAHITELSWNRLKHPSEVVKIGDRVKARVIAVDPEKKRISLTLKSEADNPWNRFVENYKVGDIIDAKIVKLMNFGAFAEVLPGVDGLIHISQLSDRRVGKVSDAVKEGDIVKVKIVDINTQKEKISLSIRLAMEELGISYSTESQAQADQAAGDEQAKAQEAEETGQLAEAEKVQAAETVEEEAAEVAGMAEEEAPETDKEEAAKEVEEEVTTAAEEQTAEVVEEETAEVPEEQSAETEKEVTEAKEAVESEKKEVDEETAVEAENSETVE